MSSEYSDWDEADWSEDEGWYTVADQGGAGRPTFLGAGISWVTAALRGLLDVRFRVVATTTLLPAVYVLGLVVSVAVPTVLTVVIFQVSALLGALFLVVLAAPMALAFAATMRLTLEFLVNMTHLAGKVTHMTNLADDLHQTLADVAEPVSQLSEDFRAVQFWRFRQRRSTAAQRRVRN
ncbi:DUF4282 domain-containing protein [Skermania sp. ID1734]|uniref:DUF4282 domain-containing protein n=1 Tax=Skermania sp. ID1734 TaxID=2597516 RepID=UPI00117C9A3B|nr:DUF4282 domain-containing protein [Skermania sp. ID1734]TSE00722.1 DUF4282 domain-containing protein [Skermania sp. ID1734]